MAFVEVDAPRDVDWSPKAVPDAAVPAMTHWRLRRASHALTDEVACMAWRLANAMDQPAHGSGEQIHEV